MTDYYFKTFDEWNNKYKDLSVSAEQYTIMQILLKEADAEVANLKQENKNLKIHLVKNEVSQDFKKLMLIFGVAFALSMLLHGTVILYLTNL